MRLRQVWGCHDASNRFTGLSMRLRDINVYKELILTTVGSLTDTCDTFVLGLDDFVNSMEVGWDAKGLTSVAMSTNAGIIATFGEKRLTNTAFIDRFTFSEENQLVGLYGSSSKNGLVVNNIGAIIYSPECGLASQKS